MPPINAMPNQTPTPAVAVFDVNETLSDLSGLTARCEEAGVDPGILPAWFAATLRDGFALTAAGGYADFSEIATFNLSAWLAGADAPPADPRDAARRIVEAMAELDLHPDVADGLRKLHAAGVRIVTLSNGSRRVAESLLDRAGLRHLVERCLSVSDAGRWKPAPEAYARAVRDCRVEPREMTLIAVHPWDIDGAARAGLRTGWLSRDRGAYPSYLRAPDAVGHDLPELVERLTGVAGR